MTANIETAVHYRYVEQPTGPTLLADLERLQVPDR
jgi:hypothetical protein